MPLTRSTAASIASRTRGASAASRASRARAPSFSRCRKATRSGAVSVYAGMFWRATMMLWSSCSCGLSGPAAFVTASAAMR